MRLGIKTLHRCQVVALDWSRFNPSTRLLMAVKLMDLIVPPWLNRRDITILLKEGPATLVDKVPFFSLICDHCDIFTASPRGAENGQGIERFAGPWSRPRPTRGPRGPAGLLAIRNAGRQRSRVVLREDRRARDQDADHQGQRHDFCHVPSAPGVARIAGPTSMPLAAEVRDLAGGNAALVRVIQASRRLPSTSARSRGCADRRLPRRCV